MIDEGRHHLSVLQESVHRAMDAVRALDRHGSKLTVAEIARMFPDDPAVKAYWTALQALNDAVKA